MKNITIKSIDMQNFKGAKNVHIDFSNKAIVKGANATGKTTIFDAFTWLLFGKNSQGVEKFDVRPLDDDGKQIDLIDIVVVANLEIDGKPVELKKIQKQKWVKQRGAEEQTFQGNVNEYSVNDFPKSEKEYKAFIADIISEDIFKIITNPMYFTSLNWKDQRKALMKFANSETDYELAKRIGGFDLLLPELEIASCTDDIQKKWTKSKKELNQLQVELPVRVDELSNQKVDYDLAELELLKKDLESKQSADDNKAKMISLNEEIMRLEFKKNDIVARANSELNSKRSKLNTSIFEADSRIRQLQSSIDFNERSKKSTLERIEFLKDHSMSLGDKYRAREKENFNEAEWKFDESSAICISCGQMLPKSKIETLKADFDGRKAQAKMDFESRKKADMKSLVDEGNKVKEERIELEKKIGTYDSEIAQFKKELEVANQVRADHEAELNAIPVSADMTGNTEYLETIDLINKKVAEVDALAKEPIVTDDSKAELDEINRKISAALNNENIDKRIEELEDELKGVGQRVAKCEQMLYLLEEFVKAKLNSVEGVINSKFEIVNFKLFNIQINSGIEETCTCTVDGVPFASLNNGSRIVAGLDICRTLSKEYGVLAPIFIDNAESINEFNVPKMECQTISLFVTNDDHLVIEN